MFEPTAGRTFGSNRRQMAAWIIPPAGHGNVRIVQVGSGSSLTRPITEWHKALQETAASIAQDGEKSATDRLRKATGPLSKRLGKSKSPDPFDLFEDSQPRQLVKRRTAMDVACVPLLMRDLKGYSKTLGFPATAHHV
jgi:hypothetical protein